MEERRAVYRVSVGKPEGKRPLGRPRRRWDYNIKMVNLKQSRNRPGVAQRFPEGLGSQIFMTFGI